MKFSFFGFCIPGKFLKIKELLIEKLEDLQDIGVIKRIKEEKKENYFCASDIDELYE